MALKLMMSAQTKWRKLDGANRCVTTDFLIVLRTIGKTRLSRRSPAKLSAKWPKTVSGCGQRHFEPSRDRTGASDHQLCSRFGMVRADQGEAVQDDLHHLAALCLFMFGTGARRGEACALTWSGVELFQKKAMIKQTKTDDQRVAHLSPPVIAALANIPSNRKPDSLVLQYASGESVGQVWNNVIERAGIEKLSPHCCRHGFATSMLQAGIDPKICCGTRWLERRWNSYEILCPCDG
ncbi:MAG: hypothetical protein ACJASV_000001 [Pseudorhodobacter sp.]|jgi:hypothetical protein